MKTLQVNVSKAYPIHIGSNILESNVISDYCKLLDKSLAIITDSNLETSLGKKLKEKLNAPLFIFKHGEENKTRETKQLLEDQLLKNKFGRDTCLIALGGGVVTDLVGFVASTYCRGVSVIYVPTSLLAMVDASIGGKTGVNTPFGKNLIGTFHQPQAVFIDTSVLKTLPDKEWRSGLSEVIKHALISDKALFNTIKENVAEINRRDSSSLLEELLYQSIVIKKNVVEKDEKETGLRSILNFGHTIGHAIESLENYQLSHGEAVAIGLVVEAYLSVLCGFLDKNIPDQIVHLLREYQLPLKTNAFKDKNAFIELLSLDKKAQKQTAQFVLLDTIGKVHQENGRYAFPVDPKLLNKALDWARDRFSC